MRNCKLNIGLIVILSFLFFLVSGAKNYAQDSLTVDDYRTLFYFNILKQSDDSRVLEVEFLARNKENKKDKIAVIKAPINFYNVTDEEEILLGNANTDMEGKAKFIVASDYNFQKGEDGYYTLLARFDGSDALDEEEEELSFLDVELDLELSLEDSIKMIYVTASTLDSLGEELAVEELDIIIGVEGMLSRMPLDEGTLEEGEYEFELEEEIPGDHNGDINFYVFIDDHEDFLYVEKTQKIRWGSSLYEQEEKNNLLWTKAAPVWMYIVLTILLVGIWANFVFTIRHLYKIKKLGTN